MKICQALRSGFRYVEACIFSIAVGKGWSRW